MNENKNFDMVESYKKELNHKKQIYEYISKLLSIKISKIYGNLIDIS